MTFRDAETLPVRARDAVMQIYIAAREGGFYNLTVEVLQCGIHVAYDREGPRFGPYEWDILGAILIFRRLGFSKDVMLTALAELQIGGEIPTNEAVRARLEREVAQAKEILSGHKKPTR